MTVVFPLRFTINIVSYNFANNLGKNMKKYIFCLQKTKKNVFHYKLMGEKKNKNKMASCLCVKNIYTHIWLAMQL